MSEENKDWNELHKKLKISNHRPPFVAVGDIWWASLGENIGSEINGKGELFSRPVVIYKKLSHKFYLVLPTTSQIRSGTWYVTIGFAGKKATVCLNQARTLDYRRLFNRLGALSLSDIQVVRDGFNRLYG